MTRFSETGEGPNVLDWDVLNEPLHELHYSNTFVAAGIYPNAKAAFADYFVRADALRPDAVLAINDYNILSSGGDGAARQYRNLINDLLDLGAPIDQIKVQAHMGRMISKADALRRLDILAETGLPIAISEFDMRDDNNQISPANQKILFKSMLEAAFEHPAVNGFSMWGIWDPGHWRFNGPLFNSDWSVKDEAAPWFDLVQGAWKSEQLDQPVDELGRWGNTLPLFDGLYDVTATRGDQFTTVEDTSLTNDRELTITIQTEPPTLTLNLAADSISEGDGETATTATVTRNGDLSSELVVSLASSDTSEASVPTAVTIAANQASATFTIAAEDDIQVDGNQSVTLTASATDYTMATDSLEVIDDDIPTLTFELNANSIAEDGSTQATISRNTATTDELVVKISSDDTGEATLPETITIPVGQVSATVKVSGVLDLIVDGDQDVSFVARQDGFLPGGDTLSVTDIDVPTLTIEVDNSSISENLGSATVTVTRNTDPSVVLTVLVSSSDETEATVPERLVIGSGLVSDTFQVSGVDDLIVDGAQFAVITVNADGFSGGEVTIEVTDNDVLELAVSFEAESIAEGGEPVRATVTRNGDTTEALIVSLEANLDEQVTIPNQVTIPAGQASATFDIRALDDVIVEEDLQIQITATATQYQFDAATILLMDDDVWSWTNPVYTFDVNDDGLVSPVDVLLVINYLNANGSGPLPSLNERAPFFYDTSSDDIASPIDVLLIINFLNTPEGEAEEQLELNLQLTFQDERERERRSS